MENSLNIKNLKFSKNKHKGKHKRKYYLNSKNINKDENQESQSILSNNLNENEIIKKNVIEVNQCNNRLEEDLVTPSMKISKKIYNCLKKSLYFNYYSII